MDTQETVQVIVDNSIVQKLRNSFTSFECVIKEAMQNSRRANATMISFSSSDDGQLTIRDDGDGFNSLQDFLTLSGSGWGQDVIDKEGAFGMGSFSMVYASSYIKVASNGQFFEGNTDDILNGSPIRIEASETSIGTVITLKSSQIWEKRQFAAIVKKLAVAFQIDVYVNGEKCEQPYRLLDDGSFIETEIGQCRIAGMNAEMGTKCGSREITLFYQGLPVSTPYHHRGRPLNIIHLNESMFDVRMPDRDVLIDNGRTYSSIIMELTATWRNYLAVQKRTMTAFAFANSFYDNLAMWGCLHLLNDVPVLPGSAIFTVTEEPHCQRMYQEDYFTTPANSIHRNDVNKLLSLDGSIEPESIGEWTYAYHMDAICLVKDSLDPGHWIHSHVIKDLDLSVKSVGQKKEAFFNGEWVYENCIFSDEIQLNGALGSIDIKDSPVFHANAFYIPKGVSDGSYVLLANIFNDDDGYNEVAKKNEEQIFAAFLMVHNRSTTEALKAALDNRFIAALGISSQKFELTFGKSGIEVTEIVA